MPLNKLTFTVKERTRMHARTGVSRVAVTMRFCQQPIKVILLVRL